MPTKIHSKRTVGDQVYSTTLFSRQQAQEAYGLTNTCYTFHYLNKSVADSARQFEMCNMSTARQGNGQLPLFNMSGLIQVLPNGYVMNSRGLSKDCKNVYVVVFCRMGGLNHPNNSTLANTLAIPYSGGYGYKTMREAIDHARRHMINHFYAIRGVHGEGMENYKSLQHFILKPYVRKELVAAVAQVDAALATTPVDLDKFKAAAQRLQMDCDALTAIHNASKPCGTTIAILSKESMSGDANAVLPNATWEDLKKLEFVHYQDCCDKLRQDAAKEIKDVERRLQVRLKQEEEHHWRVVDQVCDRSKTVEDRLTYLQNLYGKNATIVGKRLDVYT